MPSYTTSYIVFGYLPTTAINAGSSPTCALQIVRHGEPTRVHVQEVELAVVLTRRLGPKCYLFVQRPEWALLACRRVGEPEHIQLMKAYILHAPCTLTEPIFSLTTLRRETVTKKSNVWNQYQTQY